MEAISPELVLIAPPHEAAHWRALLPLPPTWDVDAARIRPLGRQRREVPRPLLVTAIACNVVAIGLGLFVSPRPAQSAAPPSAPPPAFAELDLAALTAVEPPGLYRFAATPR
jgi:hypothetical protein